MNSKCISSCLHSGKNGSFPLTLEYFSLTFATVLELICYVYFSLKQESKIVDKLLLEEEIRHKSEIALQEKEEMLWKTLEEKKAALEKEMESIEGELRMKDIANQTELEDLLASKKRLEQILTNKEAEQKLLEKQLEEAKEASKQEKESALKIKEDVLSNFAELMETELQCSICSELFVQVSISYLQPFAPSSDCTLLIWQPWDLAIVITHKI